MRGKWKISGFIAIGIIIALFIAGGYGYLFSRPEYELAKKQIQDSPEIIQLVGPIEKVNSNWQASIERSGEGGKSYLVCAYQFYVRGNHGMGTFEARIKTNETECNVQILKVSPDGSKETLADRLYK